MLCSQHLCPALCHWCPWCLTHLCQHGHKQRQRWRRGIVQAAQLAPGRSGCRSYSAGRNQLGSNVLLLAAGGMCQVPTFSRIHGGKLLPVRLLLLFPLVHTPHPGAGGGSVPGCGAVWHQGDFCSCSFAGAATPSWSECLRIAEGTGSLDSLHHCCSSSTLFPACLVQRGNLEPMGQGRIMREGG